tara:strand:+ start:3406 stop:3624 length:219 start_codon:yes stop_codon:yes gene_type:complete
LAWSLEDILAEVDNMQNEQKNIKSDLMKICWYMRGGVSLDEAFALSYEDKEIISSIIKDNLETTKKSGLPFF